MSPDIDWPAVVKKDAKGLNGEDLGEVQQVGDTFVTIGKGFIYKISFFIPKDLVKGYDGYTLRLKITEEEARSRFSGWQGVFSGMISICKNHYAFCIICLELM